MLLALGRPFGLEISRFHKKLLERLLDAPESICFLGLFLFINANEKKPKKDEKTPQLFLRKILTIKVESVIIVIVGTFGSLRRN